MATAAVLEVLVTTPGIRKVNDALGGVDTSLRKTAGSADKAAGSLEDTGKRGGKSFGVLKKAAGALGGVAVFGGLIAGAKAAVSEFQEARKVGALTENVIRSTGGAANITAGQVGKLAMSISNKTAIDDEAIQSGANLLLTFKNIRNETGKGRDIFNQATAAAVDLSASGFGSLESTSKQLGKALNDPVKGMTALGKSGVTFSEDQKKAIAALMETGKASDRVRAQQMILKEVQSQVGGAAAAQATPMDKLRVTLGNLAEAAGSVLVPALDKGARFLTTLLGGMIESKGAGGAMVDVFKTTGSVLADTVGVVVNVVKWFKEHKTVTLALAAAAGVLLAAFIGFQVVAGVVALIRGMVTAFWALNAAMAANPIGLVVVAIAALVAGLVVAYRESETFRNIVDGAFKGVSAAFGWVLQAAQDVFGWLKDHWQLVLGILTGPIGLAVVAIATHVDEIVAFFKALPARIFDAIKGGAALFAQAVTWVKDQIVGGIKAYIGLYIEVGKWIVNRLVDGIKGMAGAIADAAGWLKNRVVEGVHAVAAGFLTLGGWILNRVVDGFKVIGELLASVGGWLKNRFTEIIQLSIEGFVSIGGWILNRIVDGFKVVSDALGSIGGWLKNRVGDLLTAAKDGFFSFGGKIMGWIVDGLKDGANLLVGFVNKIIDVINKIPGVDIGHIKGFAEGGVNGGPNGNGRLAAQGLAHGGAFARTGGVVSSPITLMGEEAPRHPEFVIPTNPAYRGRARMLLGQAAGAIGLAEGGVIAAFRSAIDRTDANPKPSLALWEAGIVESGLRNLPYGDADSTGALQVRARTAGPMGINPMNPLQVAMGFLTRGYWGKGSAMQLAARNPSASAGWVAQQTQGSAFPDRYDAVRGQALQYLGSVGTGATATGSVGTTGGGIGGILGDILSGGASFLLDKLPGIGDLPKWLQGTGSYVLKEVGGWIKDKVAGLIGAQGGGGGTTGGALPPGSSAHDAFMAMQRTANDIHGRGYPYVYGGGHNGSFSGPYDCSGAVSAVLHAAGLLSSPITTDGLKTFGMAGDGKQVTIGVRGSTGRNAHTMMKIGSRFFESGSGHGARWVNGWSGNFPIHRHPGGMAQGGIYEDLKRLGPRPDPDIVGWGLAKGGAYGPVMGSYAQGTDYVPRTGPYMLHKGESVTPARDKSAGDNGPLEIELTVKGGGGPLEQALADMIDVRIKRNGRELDATWKAGAQA